jgi:acetyl-CoA C-acetyltransferase
MHTRETVVVSTARTPIGKFGGSLVKSSAVGLGAAAIRGAVERSGIDPASVSETIVGHARQANNGPNPGRLMAIGAGIPEHVPAHTTQQACLSSLKSAILGSQAIALGEADIVVAAGSEHMSSIPYFLTGMRWGTKAGDSVAIDGLSADGFLDPLTGRKMGELAEAWSDRFGIDREAQDRFALQSQLGAQRGIETGFAKHTIVPLEIPSRRGPTTVDSDEHPRPDSSLEGLGRLRPAFSAATVLAAADKAEELGLAPLARIVSWAIAAVEPADYGLAVVPASNRALERAGLAYDEIDHIEINEAFAIMVLAACAQMDVDPARVNPYGGAIALGHPVGASGARVLQYAAEGLARDGGRYALATICGNGGQGAAVVLERV